jgi:uncharacterized protein YqgC (DUF456 family)
MGEACLAPTNMSQVVRTIIGVALLILGVIGSLLPIVPGFVFFAAGIAVLGTDHAILRRFQPYVLRGRVWLEKRGILKPKATS